MPSSYSKTTDDYEIMFLNLEQKQLLTQGSVCLYVSWLKSFNKPFRWPLFMNKINQKNHTNLPTIYLL